MRNFSNIVTMNIKPIRTIRRAAEWTLIQTPHLNSLYWCYAPTYYRWRLKPDTGDTGLPIDPFKIHTVNPDTIDRFSGIYGATIKRVHDIGSIKQGDWDKNTDRLKKSAITAERLSDTLLYSSMVDHFILGKQWKETDIVTQFENSSGRHHWHGCHTVEDVLERCSYIDEVYDSIKKNGYRSQMELLKETSGRPPLEIAGFLNVLVNEITVDVGRSGELLLADGRHRLAIAKILGIDSVPILIMARHEKWIGKLQEREEEALMADNPDVRYIR